MKDLVLYIARMLVANKDAVDVTETPGERGTVYEFKVDPSEVGKVIGREGKTIHAIRTVVQGAARAQGKRVLVEVAHGRPGSRPPAAGNAAVAPLPPTEGEPTS